MTRRRVGVAVCGAIAACFVAGCGSSGTDPQGGGQAKPIGDPGSVTFPDLGYRKLPPQYPAHVSRGTALVVDLTNTAFVRPTQMALAMGATAAGLHWSNWGAAQTTGRGISTIRICTTSCGAGYNRQYPITVSLSGLRTCSGHRFYLQATAALSGIGSHPPPTVSTKPFPAVLKDPC